MSYIAFNQRSAAILSTTKHTGYYRWHERNHTVYDKALDALVKYIGRRYGEHASASGSISTYSYSVDSFESHIDTWWAHLERLCEATKNMYYEACEAGNFELADMLKCLNKMNNNELLRLKDVERRLKGASDTDKAIVNHEIHEWFKSHMDCHEIDFAI